MTTALMSDSISRQRPALPVLASHDSVYALLLSREEISALTGSKQAARQRRWLDARGWPYAEACGRAAYPRVARQVFLEKMQGRDPSLMAPEPRFDALDRLARLAP